MATNKIIMAWSECSVKIGKTNSDDTFATDALTSIGTIKDKSSTLEPSDGEVLEAKKTGGKTVAKEVQEGGYTFKTRVIEPTSELLVLLGIATAEAENEQKVATHIVSDDWSLQVDPKNVGAKGLKAPKTSISYKPGWSEEEGNYADIEFEILQGEAGYWYSRYTKQATT